METIIELITHYFGPWGYLLLLPFLYGLVRFAFVATSPLTRRFFRARGLDENLRLSRYLGWPVTIVIWSLVVLMSEAGVNVAFHPEDWKLFGLDLFASLFILSVSFCIYRVMVIFLRLLRASFDTSVTDNLYQRKILTQLQYVEKIIFIILALVSLSLVLLRFETLANFGGGVLASAGVASVVIGFAAQESVSNLIAGFQIAFTQPLRIDDAVVVENEWGYIEEITLTYIVVRIWDRRRLVLPIKYVTTKAFQNWTRNQSQIIGAVYLFLDHRAPISKIRGVFEEMVKASELWDQDVQVLQVVDATEKTIQIRALMSAKDAPTAWDLRCEIREKLIDYIQRECPEALPLHRVLTESTEKKSEQSPSLFEKG